MHHSTDPQTCFISRNSSRMTTTSRKRSRRCRRSSHHNRSTVAVAAAVATATQLLLLLQQPRDVQAWVAPVSPTSNMIRRGVSSSSSSRLLATSLSTDYETTGTATNTAQSYYDYDLAYSSAYYDDDEDDDEFENDEFEEDIAGFLELQSSTGSEILPTALQELVNQGPSTFLQDADMVSGRDVSDLELVAMRSITEQLPQAAVRQAAVQQQQAQQQQQQEQQQQKKKTTRKSSTGKVMAKKKKTKNSQEENKVTKKTKAKKKSTASTTTTGSSSASSSSSASGVSNKKKKKHKNNLHYADSPRVTPEQEMELARTIQQGAALHKLWTDHVMSLQESDNESSNSSSHGQHHGRRPLLKKWAQLAGLTPKELRRQVADYRQAKHVLVTANMGLVHAVVNQVWSSGPKYRQAGISKDELVQEGSLGLLRAAELFDPARGLRFSTYAVVWIKGTLSNTHVPELVRLPAREKTKWNKIQQAQRDILLLQQQQQQQQQGQNGGSSGSNNNNDVAAVAQQQPHSPLQLRVPVEEIAAYTGLTVAEILATQRHMSRTKHVLSLDYEYQTQSRSGDAAVADSCSMLSRITDKSTANLASQTQLQADVLAAMAHNLDAREGRLMRLRYGLSEDGQTRTLQECADAMGLSYTRVHQLAARCLKKLRQAAEAESLQEYLLTIA